jgi:hypothetical protein
MAFFLPFGHSLVLFHSLCWLTHTTKDDLPIWGMVGEYDAANDKYKLFTHKALEIHYNNDRIIKVRSCVALLSFRLFFCHRFCPLLSARRKGYTCW